MEERELAQVGTKHGWGQVPPQQQGAKGTLRSPPSAPAPPTGLPPQLRLQEGRVVGGSSAEARPHHHAHLDEERHGRDLPAWLLPAEQLDQAVCDPVTQVPRDTAYLSGKGAEGTVNTGRQTSLGTDSHRPSLPPPPLARRKAVPSTSRLLLGRRPENHPSCPQSLPFCRDPFPTLSILPCPGWGCLREGTLALWEVAAPVHPPPLPGFSSLLGHPLVTSPSHPRPRGLWGAGGEMAGGAGRRGLSPGQQTHCAVAGLSVEECVPATLTFDFKHHILVVKTAEECFHGQHCKSVCRAKPRSRWEPWPRLRGHGRDGKSEMEHLSGLVGRQPSCWHPLQKVSTSSGISSVLKKIWKSRARKRRGKCTFKLSRHLGRQRISRSALVACRKQDTQRQRSVPRRPRGRA